MITFRSTSDKKDYHSPVIPKAPADRGSDAAPALNPFSSDDPLCPIKNLRGLPSPETCWGYSIQDGFRITLLDILPERTLRLKYEKDRAILNFGFILSGNYINRIKAPGLTGKGFSNQAGASGILYLPRQEGELILSGGIRMQVVHIHLSLPAFHDLFHTEEAAIPKELQSVLSGSVDHAYAFRAGMSPNIRWILERLLQGPSPGTPARLFYQGIALELMAGQIARANNRLPAAGQMSPGEQDRLIHARNLLIRDLTSPPCLKQLSRQTGLNMNKLQQGFQRLYGASVYQYLHRYRMQEANRIFHETDMNVTQAAFAVGYSNVSHFSRAYKKHFNILPKKHLAGIKAYTSR